MMIAEALRQGTAFLQGSASPSARLDAEVLLGHCLGLRRVALYVQAGRSLTEEEKQSYWALLQRRARKEPVAYLVGQKEFFGLTFLVDQRVLIPRPETEVLVEQALACADTLGRGDLLIADIGTGSGCIAVALACRLPQARVYATEISTEAAEVAQENIRRHDLEDRVVLLRGDLCAPLPEAVDLLVANPPYTVWDSLPEGITAFEPRVALDGGIDGLELYGRLLPQIAAHLRPEGFALVEMGNGQEEAVLALVQEQFQQVSVQTWLDYSGVERVVIVGPY